MKAILEAVCKKAAEIPLAYRLFIGAVVGVVSLILVSLLGTLLLVLIALIVWTPAWLISGYYITVQNVSAPLWADRYLWFSSPFALLALGLAAAPIPLSWGTLLLLSICTCLWFIHKLAVKGGREEESNQDSTET